MADPENATGTSKERLESVSQGTKQTLTWIVELLTIFGLLGFLGSTFLNSYVFSFWGLNFLQVAGPSDVIMSGLQLSIDLISISVTALCGFIIGKILFIHSPPYEEIGKSRPLVKYVHNARVGVSMIVCFGAIPFGIYIIVNNISSLYTLHLVALAVGFTVGNVNVSKYWTGDLLEKSLSVIVTVAVLGVFFYAYVQAFLSKESVIGGGVEDGFLSKGHAFRIDTPYETCPQAVVLWVGERSLIARCEKLQRIILIDHGENSFIR